MANPNYVNADLSLKFLFITKEPITLITAVQGMYVCMYVCVRGGPIRPLHRDPQWSIVLPLSLIIPSAIPHFGYSAGFYMWGCRDSHLVP
jgi:hypothetical protein